MKRLAISALAFFTVSLTIIWLAAPGSLRISAFTSGIHKQSRELAQCSGTLMVASVRLASTPQEQQGYMGASEYSLNRARATVSTESEIAEINLLGFNTLQNILAELNRNPKTLERVQHDSEQCINQLKNLKTDSVT
jgi:hypothetical protein